MDRKPTSYRLTTVAVDLIAVLAKGLGVSQTAVIEMAVRKLANETKISQ
jgi:hypothetical protein